MAIKKEVVPSGPSWRVPTWFPDLPKEQEAQLKSYQDLLQKFNPTLNLVSSKTLSIADATHFADSILAYRLISDSVKSGELYDFGSGNGFPGIVIGVLNPKLSIRLVEIDERKCEFMKQVVATLGLKNTQILRQSVENVPAASVKYAISRGFAPMAKALLMTRKVVAPGGCYFHMKSEEWATEVASIPTQLCSHWLPSLVGEYRLPVGEIRFALVKTDRIGT